MMKQRFCSASRRSAQDAALTCPDENPSTNSAWGNNVAVCLQMNKPTLAKPFSSGVVAFGKFVSLDSVWTLGGGNSEQHGACSIRTCGRGGPSPESDTDWANPGRAGLAVGPWHCANRRKQGRREEPELHRGLGQKRRFPSWCSLVPYQKVVTGDLMLLVSFSPRSCIRRSARKAGCSACFAVGYFCHVSPRLCLVLHYPPNEA
ncbi:hypothetical protein B0J18DRAFT_224738 [Chaetomium sp. MPI-SDFR-AT-0129]|nr:hypothetical protein B0J18DRAFT_224738 [Chaetomium sp. MPI-SDFR-AT-0129]